MILTVCRMLFIYVLVYGLLHRESPCSSMVRTSNQYTDSDFSFCHAHNNWIGYFWETFTSLSKRVCVWNNSKTWKVLHTCAHSIKLIYISLKSFTTRTSFWNRGNLEMAYLHLSQCCYYCCDAYSHDPLSTTSWPTLRKWLFENIIASSNA